MKNIKTVENVCDFDEVIVIRSECRLFEKYQCIDFHFQQIIFPKKFGKPGENGPYIVNTKDKQQGIRVQKCRYIIII